MFKVPKEIIAEIQYLPGLLENYVSQHVNLERKGSVLKGLCPFHEEKTPSFTINQRGSYYKCFGCGRGGNIFTFAEAINRVGFYEALVLIAEYAGFDLSPYKKSENKALTNQRNVLKIAHAFFQSQLKSPKGKKALEMLVDKGYDEEMINDFELGYAPNTYEALVNHFNKKRVSLEDAHLAGLINPSEYHRSEEMRFYSRFRNRIMWPIHTPGGSLAGFAGRRVDETVDPKYLNSSENALYVKGSLLYGLHRITRLAREKGYIVLVEGYTDADVWQAQGIPAVASAGTALTNRQIKLLKNVVRGGDIYFMYDADSAGAKAVIRSIPLFVEQDIWPLMVTLEGEGMDPNLFALGKKNLEEVFFTLPKENIQQYIIRNKNPQTLAEKMGVIREINDAMSAVGSLTQKLCIINEMSEQLGLDPSIGVLSYVENVTKNIKELSNRYDNVSPLNNNNAAREDMNYYILWLLNHTWEYNKTSIIQIDANDLPSEIFTQRQIALYEIIANESRKKKPAFEIPIGYLQGDPEKLDPGSSNAQYHSFMETDKIPTRNPREAAIASKRKNETWRTLQSLLSKKNLSLGNDDIESLQIPIWNYSNLLPNTLEYYTNVIKSVILQYHQVVLTQDLAEAILQKDTSAIEEHKNRFYQICEKYA